jgi:hypothetical protein
MEVLDFAAATVEQVGDVVEFDLAASSQIGAWADTGGALDGRS